MTVGTYEDSERAARDGEHIGGGYTREVYRIGNVVYKIDSDNLTNEIEYNNGERLRGNVPVPFTIPPMTLYPNGVLAMPYIDGERIGECFCLENEAHYSDCLPAELVPIANKINIDAGNWGNLIKKNGTYYVVDLGC